MFALSSHVPLSMLLRVSHRVWYINDLVRLSTLIGWMVSLANGTTRRLTLTPTLPRYVPPTTKVMKLIPYSRMPSRTRLTTSKLTSPVLAITSFSIVLLLWWTIALLIPISTHPTKLLSVTRLTALHTPHILSVSTRLYRGR